MSVSAGETELVIEVSDDGVGFDSEALCEAVARGHIGLASLVERVAALGPDLTAVLTPDGLLI